MATGAGGELTYEFAGFQLNPAERRLLRDGAAVPLTPKAFDLLVYLVQRQGRLVEKATLMAALWPDTIVEEANLAFQISALRKALGDGANGDALIQTVPTKGYRFVGIVTAVGQVALAVSQPPLRRWWRSPWMWLGCAIVAALGALVSTGRTRKSEIKPPAAFILNPQQVQIRKLTDSDEVSDVAISPDGRYVIFVRGDAHNQGLWLRQIDTRTDVEILHADGTDFHGLTFSPDGSLIYFLKNHRDDPFTRSLDAMSILGGATRTLIDDVDGPISFAPDGKQFVYEVCGPTGLQIRIARVDRDRDRQLAVIRNADCALSQPGPRWSPDGKTVAVPARVQTEPQHWILAGVSVADRTLRVLHSCNFRIGRPAWIAGGQALLVPHAEEDFSENQLWTVTFPGGEATRVTDNLTSYGMLLDSTPDGRLAVSTVITRISNIWVVPAGDPGRARQVSEGLPLWMATELLNGQLLAVGTDGRLWSMAPDGSQRVQFSSLRYVDSFVRCGHTVVASANDRSGAVTTGTMTYVRIDMDGTHATPLISGSLWPGVACSDAGGFLFYVRRVPDPLRLFKVPLAGGAAMEVGHSLPVGAAWPVGVSPDETQLAFLERLHPPSGDGWRVDVVRSRDGARVASWPVQLSAYYPQQYRWTPEGLACQFLRADKGVYNVWEQQLAGGAPRQLTRFTSGQIFRFEWSIDMKRLVMTRGSISHDVVLLNLK